MWIRLSAGERGRRRNDCPCHGSDLHQAVRLGSGRPVVALHEPNTGSYPGATVFEQVGPWRAPDVPTGGAVRRSHHGGRVGSRVWVASRPVPCVAG